MPRAHIEQMRGTPRQASDYCKKDGCFAEHGVHPKGRDTTAATEKRKADYALAMELAKQQRIYDIEPGLAIRHMSSLKQIARDHLPELQDNENLCGVWFVGPPGVGKSRAARWLYPHAYPKPINKWWDGYKNQEYVIMDDWDVTHKVLGHHLKIWSDHYPFIAEQKGSSIMARPQIICVTSNYSIEEIWCEDPMMCQAILRRFKVHEFK